MDNKENILDELTNFEKRKPKEIPQILEDYLIRIAKTGDTMFPWTKLKPLFMFKMERVISEFHENSPTDDLIPCPNMERFKFDAMKEKLLEAIDNFSSSAPFTIQRLCELITSPRKHYKHTEKFMRGLEKNVLVVSTVEPGCSHIFACDCARKRSDHQSSALMNGILDTHNGVDNENNNGEFISKEVSIMPPADISTEYTETEHQHTLELNTSSDDNKVDIADVEMKSVDMNGSQEAMDTSPSEENEALLPAEVVEPFEAMKDADTPLSTELTPPVETEIKAAILTDMDTTLATEVTAPLHSENNIVNNTAILTPIVEEVATKETDDIVAKETEADEKTLATVDEEETQEKGSCNSDNTVSSSTHSPSSSSVTMVTVTATTSEACSTPAVEETDSEASHFAEAEVVAVNENDVREAGGDASSVKEEKVDEGVDSSSVDSQPLSPSGDTKSEASGREVLSENKESATCDTGGPEEVQPATSSENDTEIAKTEVTGSDEPVVENAEESSVTKSSEPEQPSSSDVSDEHNISASSELTIAPAAAKLEEEESMVTTTPTEEATSTPAPTPGDEAMAAPNVRDVTSAEDTSSLPLQAESSSSSSSSSSSPSTSSLSPQHISTTEAEDNTNEANAADSSPVDKPNPPANAEVGLEESEPMEQD